MGIKDFIVEKSLQLSFNRFPMRSKVSWRYDQWTCQITDFELDPAYSFILKPSSSNQEANSFTKWDELKKPKMNQNELNWFFFKI